MLDLAVRYRICTWLKSIQIDLSQDNKINLCDIWTVFNLRHTNSVLPVALSLWFTTGCSIFIEFPTVKYWHNTSVNGAFVGSCVVWRMVGFNHDMASFIEICWKILFAKSRLFFLDYDLFLRWHLGEVITSFVLRHIAKIKINSEYIAVYTSMMLLRSNRHWPAITRANTEQDACPTTLGQVSQADYRL